MGAYCTLVYIRRHAAKMGEIMEVRRIDPYYYVAVFGDNDELACIPHRGCRLEIVATPETAQCFAAYLATYAFGTSDACLGKNTVNGLDATKTSILDAYAGLATEDHFTQRKAQ